VFPVKCLCKFVFNKSLALASAFSCSRCLRQYRRTYLKAALVTARRVCISRTMPWQYVCLSVRPSIRHTPVLCLNGYTYPKKNFPPSSSPNILVFPHQTGWKYSDGNTPNGGVECKGYEKVTIFDQYLALSRNCCKIEP